MTNETKAQHTPTPWEVHVAGDYSTSVRVCKPTENERGCIAIAEAEILYIHREVAEANALFIVQACNNFETLLEACKLIDKWALNPHDHDPDGLCPDDCIARVLQKAIAQAEGGVA